MTGKFWTGFIVVFIAFLIMDFIFHNLILAGLYEKVEFIRDSSEWNLWVGVIMILLTSFLFAFIYFKFVGKKSLIRGIGYGLYLGLALGLVMGYGMYTIMPIPYWLAFSWFITCIVELTVSGFLAGLLIKEPAEKEHTESTSSSHEASQVS